MDQDFEKFWEGAEQEKLEHPKLKLLGLIYNFIFNLINKK